MKKIVFLTLTLLSLINVEAFASQPQPAKPTSSWWSWAPYAAGTAAFAGAALSHHFYNKYANEYRQASKSWKTKNNDAKLEAAKEAVKPYKDQVRQLCFDLYANKGFNAPRLSDEEIALKTAQLQSSEKAGKTAEKALAELEQQKNEIASLSRKGSLAKWTAIGSWTAIGGLAGAGIYNWLTGK